MSHNKEHLTTKSKISNKKKLKSYLLAEGTNLVTRRPEELSKIGGHVAVLPGLDVAGELVVLNRMSKVANVVRQLTIGYGQKDVR
jgi:hypothetical protein